jgi:hypothetical protein
VLVWTDMLDYPFTRRVASREAAVEFLRTVDAEWALLVTAGDQDDGIYDEAEKIARWEYHPDERDDDGADGADDAPRELGFSGWCEEVERVLGHALPDGPVTVHELADWHASGLSAEDAALAVAAGVVAEARGRDELLPGDVSEDEALGGLDFDDEAIECPLGCGLVADPEVVANHACPMA